jgi:hypothetical protein
MVALLIGSGLGVLFQCSRSNRKPGSHTRERGNYKTIGKAAHLYIKKIHSCLGLLIISIHEHIVLSVLTS